MNKCDIPDRHTPENYSQQSGQPHKSGSFASFLKHGSLYLSLAAGLVFSTAAMAQDSYAVSGTTILKNGAVWTAGGVNAFDQFGPSTKSRPNIKIVREIVDVFKDCPINSSEGVKQTAIGWVHPLENVVNNNRSQGQVTVLCIFGWDDNQYKEILGNTPSQVPWYNEFKTRLGVLANKFKGQPDVWIDVWNEPYAWDNVGFSETQWLSDMNDLYNTVRATGNTNIVVIPGQAMGGGEQVLVNRGAQFLSGKYNVVGTVHCYNAWTGNTQAQVESRIQSIRNAGWALLIGEVGRDQWVPNPASVLDASVSQQVHTLAWSWDGGDGSKLVENGVNTSWGNQFLPYLAQYGAFPPPQSGTDLARNKTVTVSSTESSSYPGSNAVDGNGTTRWASAFSDPQWIRVDLGASYNINRVRLAWEAAYASAFKIQVSANGSSWTDVYSTTSGTGGTQDINVSGTGRYVRMHGTQRATSWGYSLWSFEVYGSPAPSGGPVADGTYKIIARHSGKCLDVEGFGTANGSNVYQWAYVGGDNQKWTLTHLGNSQYRITGVHSGKVLDVAGGSTADGANVQIWDWANVSQQKWTLTATTGGYFSVRAVHSGKALDVSGISTADGANVHQWTYGGGNNQQWSFQAP